MAKVNFKKIPQLVANFNFNFKYTTRATADQRSVPLYHWGLAAFLLSSSSTTVFLSTNACGTNGQGNGEDTEAKQARARSLGLGALCFRMLCLLFTIRGHRACVSGSKASCLKRFPLRKPLILDEQQTVL